MPLHRLTMRLSRLTMLLHRLTMSLHRHVIAQVLDAEFLPDAIDL
ncbi:hypothetical protein [Nostoc sp.]